MSVSAILLLAAVACSRAGSHAASGDRDPSADERVSMSGQVRDDDAVRSVYALDASAPDPRAVRLCTAIQEWPAARRAACRGETVGVVVTSECVRTLSDALRIGAVTLAETDVDRCVGAMDRALAGCDWAGGAAPQPPAACLDVVRGSLARGAACRSSLECAEGLRCRGVGPTSKGRCSPPLAPGAACGGSVDALAVYTRQNGYEARHPECAGRCERGACAGAESARALAPEPVTTPAR